MYRNLPARTAAAVALVSTLLFARAYAADTIQIVPVPSSFSPNKITLHQGVTTRLEFTRTQGVHAIQSTDLGIPLTTLAPGKDVVIEVTPKKAGTYVLHCEVICGEDHDNMTLTVTVES
jgi:cytochrome c oxidase subunit 2